MVVTFFAWYRETTPCSCWVAVIRLRGCTRYLKHKKAPFLMAGNSDRDTSGQQAVLRPRAERRCSVPAY